MSLAEIARLCEAARQAIAERDWEKAKQVYLQALGLKSDQPDVHYGLATVYFQLRELTSAAHHFREVTRLDPHRAGAWVNLGAVLNLLEQYDEALGALRKGISIDNKRVEGYYNMGLVYRRKGQLDMAIQSYREALRLNPRMADACLNLANIYSEKEQHRLALEFYKQALQMRPTWDKAIEGLERTEAALNPTAVPPAPAPEGGKSDTNPDRIIDPAVHSHFLNALHSATAESEELGRLFESLLQQEVEPAIKDLSSCLLYPEGARSELDACVQSFEAALEHMRTAHRSLQAKVERVRNLGEQFQKT
jgi:tetratricopeptide (TPR) repeat protein